jgi:hypothetical protein
VQEAREMLAGKCLRLETWRRHIREVCPDRVARRSIGGAIAVGVLAVWCTIFFVLPMGTFDSSNTHQELDVCRARHGFQAWGGLIVQCLGSWKDTLNETQLNTVTWLGFETVWKDRPTWFGCIKEDPAHVQLEFSKLRERLVASGIPALVPASVWDLYEDVTSYTVWRAGFQPSDTFTLITGSMTRPWPWDWVEGLLRMALFGFLVSGSLDGLGRVFL